MIISVAVTTGIAPSNTFGAVGIQGATGIGIHGIGVRTPKAAAVAAATIGFAGLIHNPNGATFAIGAIAIILAAGMQSVSVSDVGNTINAEGAAPNEHIVMAPIDTVGPGIFIILFFISLASILM